MRVLAVGLLTLAVLVGITVSQYPGNSWGGGGRGGGGSGMGGGFLALIGLIFIILLLFSNNRRDVHVMYGNYTDDSYQIGYTG